jgi:E3 ubiquitin-protein ligase RNF115/126
MFVNRHALVPQPEHHPVPPGPGVDSNRSTSPSSRSSRPRSPDRGTQDTSGLLQSLFGGFAGVRGGNSPGGTSSGHRRSNSDHTPSRGSNSRNNLPGGWNDDLD